jgi:hypothetical protein
MRVASDKRVIKETGSLGNWKEIPPHQYQYPLLTMGNLVWSFIVVLLRTYRLRRLGSYLTRTYAKWR